MPRRCAIGCTPTKGILHVFPNPDKFPEQFNAWVQVVSGHGKRDLDHRKMRICDRHFTDRDRNRNHRLNALAVPSLFLHKSTKNPVDTNDANSTAQNQNHELPVRKNSNIISAESTNVVSASSMDTELLDLGDNSSSTTESNKVYQLVSINNQMMLVEHNYNSNLSNESNENNLDYNPNTLDKENNKDNELDSIPECDNVREVQDDSDLDSNNESCNGEVEYLDSNFEDEAYEDVEQIQDRDHLDSHNENYADVEYLENREVNQIQDENTILIVKSEEKYVAGYIDNCPVDQKNVINNPNDLINNQGQRYIEISNSTIFNNYQEYLMSKNNHNQDKPAISYSKELGATEETKLKLAPLHKRKKSTEHSSRVNEIIENFIDYIEEIRNHKGYDDQDILIYGKKGTAMALVREKKYKANQARLQELKKAAEVAKHNYQLIINEKKIIGEALQKCQTELNQAKIEIEEIVKRYLELERATNDTLRHQEELKQVKILKAELANENVALKDENTKLNNEIKELKALKENITKVFSEAQIGLLTHQNKSTYSWSEEDIKKAVFLNQIISPNAYLYLRTQMKFPLPCKNIIEKWMIERNIYIKPKRIRNKETTKYANVSTTQMQNLSESNTQIQETEPTDNAMDTVEPNRLVEYANESNIHNDANEWTTITDNFNQTFIQMQHKDKAIPSLKSVIVSNTKETETKQAVEMILEQPQMEHTDNFVSSQQGIVEVIRPGEDITLFYIDDNNAMENYVINENYIDGEANIQSVTKEHNINVGSDSVAENDNNENLANREDDASGENDVNAEIVPNAEDARDDIDENIMSDEKFLEWDLNVIENFSQNKKSSVMSRKMNWLLTCQLCMKPFDNEDLLKAHVSVHYFNTYCTTYLDAQKPYQCEFCHEMVIQKTTLVRHHLLHLGITSYNCWYPGCTYVAKSKDCLSSHASRHVAPMHVCPQCGASFIARKNLREHYSRRHAAPRVPRRCRLCHCVCRSEYTYMLHMRAHRQPPRFKCLVEGCTEALYSRLALGKHKLTHTGDARPYKCPHCPLATYSHEFLLKRHLAKHELYKIAHCMRCKQIFDTYSEYYAHLKTHRHTHQLAKYKCACNQEFTSKKKLRQHEVECKLTVNCNKVKRRKKLKKEPNDETNKTEELQAPIKQNEVAEQLASSLHNNIIQTSYGRQGPVDPNAREATIQSGSALPYQQKDNKINTVSDQLGQCKSMDKTDDSHSASVQMLDSNHDSEQQQIYVQNEIVLPYAGQPDVLSTDQDDDQQDIQSLHPIQETQREVVVNSSIRSKSEVLMRQSDCLKEAGMLEDNNLLKKENLVVNQNTDQSKIITGLTAIAAGQEINQLIPKQKVTPNLAKIHKRKEVIKHSNINILRKTAVKGVSLENIVNNVGNSSIAVRCKPNQSSVKYIISDQSVIKNVPVTSVQISEGIRQISVTQKQDYQQNKEVLPMETPQPSLI